MSRDSLGAGGDARIFMLTFLVYQSQMPQFPVLCNHID
jgi:hypothetical protein